MPHFELGESIPPNTSHAVSVSLPTWKSNVGYEEGEQWVVAKMNSGYPRFFVHKAIEAFGDAIVGKYGRPHQRAMLFPTRKIGQRCHDFVLDKAPADACSDLETVNLALDSTKETPGALKYMSPTISAVLCSKEAYPYMKQYWQHSGDGVSSRRAEFCHSLFTDGLLVPEHTPQPPQPRVLRGPRRYQRPASIDATSGSTNGLAAPSGNEHGNGDGPEAQESSRFLEERYGRNLDVSLVENAKAAIRRRIAGVLSEAIDLSSGPLPAMDPTVRGIAGFKEDDIYLLPCGMNAIFTAHMILMRTSSPRKSISFGFPYVDTLKILQKFGPGCVFYGNGADADLDELEARLRKGERYQALFCEFPSNPLLKCPDLTRIRRLADEYGFAVVVDETIGTFVNINVLPLADVVVSSLTKIFSGDCNVMGGSLVLNPKGPYYSTLKATLDQEFESTYWPEDVLFMERNSRDFKSRIDRVNSNSEVIADILLAHPNVSEVYYPKHNDTKKYYDTCKTPHGGYGGLLSCTFHQKAQAVAFYDAIETAKGPSLGTNFTLVSPYVLLAHYQELDWAKSFGVDPNLLRFSVGLEEHGHLKAIFENALKATEELGTA